MTPEQIKSLFDGNAILIIFVWGLATKYVPFLAKVPNSTIPYVGVIGYILAKLAGPQAAQAAGFNIGAVAPDLVSVILGGFTSSIWARQLYEGFGRSLIEGIFHKKKAVSGG